MSKITRIGRETLDEGTPPPPAETGHRWISLTKHCSVTGETADAVHARRRKGQWTDGVQCVVGPNGNLYVNPEEFNKWVESQLQSSSAHAA